MKYVDEFRDATLARGLAHAIAAEARSHRDYHLMEFCGGHTHAISRHGIQDLLPPNIRLIHGPGCPVCVLPIGRVDSAIALALDHGVILCTYGDVLRVPASERMSLLKAKAAGADVRMIYSSLDALRIAQENPDREVVFFAIGFETTTPPTAAIIRQAKAMEVKNFTVFCNHVLTPAAIRKILDSTAPDEGIGGAEGARLDGIIGPSHVSTVIGSRPYEFVAEEYQRPVVIAGFEPLDVMQSILMLIRQINAGRAEVENEFIRAVSRDGNPKAQSLMAEVLETRPVFEWRGLDTISHSALRITAAYGDFDTELRFSIPYRAVADHKGCECGAILRGVKEPRDCRLFGTACTPENPVGSCMVSSEGACAAHYTYGRYRDYRDVGPTRKAVND